MSRMLCTLQRNKQSVIGIQGERQRLIPSSEILEKLHGGGSIWAVPQPGVDMVVFADWGERIGYCCPGKGNSMDKGMEVREHWAGHTPRT